jgi:hypothetical protein
MLHFRALSIATVACCLSAGAAQAKSALFTAGTYTGPGTTTVCRVTNTGDRPVDVMVQPMDGDGNAESTNTATFPPGNSSGYPGTENTRYCKFTIVKGKKKAIRGSMQVSDGTGLRVVLEAR